MYETGYGSEAAQSHEVTAVEGVRKKLSPEYVHTRLQELSERLTDNGPMRRVHAGLLAAGFMMNPREGRAPADPVTVRAHAGYQADRMRRMFGQDMVRERHDIVGEISNIKRSQEAGSSTVLGYWGEEALGLLSEIEGISTEIGPVNRLEPLSAEEVRNSDGDQIVDRLRRQPFMSTSEIDKRLDPSASQLEIHLSKPFEVPAHMIMTAEGMDSWLGRGEDGAGEKSAGEEGSASSLDQIVEYAGRDTPIPPVEAMNMYVQPNGVVFYGLTGQGAHRTAAKVLRSDSPIKVSDRIKVVSLHENVLALA